MGGMHDEKSHFPIYTAFPQVAYFVFTIKLLCIYPCHWMLNFSKQHIIQYWLQKINIKIICVDDLAAQEIRYLHFLPICIAFQILLKKSHPPLAVHPPLKLSTHHVLHFLLQGNEKDSEDSLVTQTVICNLEFKYN